MAIYKATPGDMQEQGMTYTVLPTDSTEMIQSIEAMGVYTYLLSKSPDWVIRNSDIQNRFKGLGEHRVKAAIRELKRLGLLRSYHQRDTRGVITGRERDLYAHPTWNPEFRAAKPVESTIGAISTPMDTHKNPQILSISAKNHRMENPSDGKSTPLPNIDNYQLHIPTNSAREKS